MSRINLENSQGGAQSVSDRLLTLLKTRGPQQASEAGKVLGTTGEAARQQFVKLAKEGLVEAIAETRGVGRPVQLWHLTATGNARFPDTHAELTVQLLRTVRDKLGEQAIDVLIDTREQETRINYKQAMVGAGDLQERVARLAAIRSREGYMAEWRQQEDGSYLLVENHCPICAAAAVCQGFCRAELSIFTEVLQAQVERSEHILAGARRCAYRISLL
ncbi:iron-sulfur cluster biosynthesis transcriptional regulator SufR [Serratia entomophila]|jgi:radical SAM protein with 4Fe4S-binding SPASM domain|uniref:Transcriptional regulator n=1 Tax=Serratia entomophila TaxID=42906 RepID=A0ABY5CY88_9GAMM|nr:metalloregulator ArsR/SmtB family transcription factor [Serratia entomophila]UIW19774.1 transcriptional regulator [Serratia entomophila]USV02297.1 transcriptional regulator [Serratia entomophila]CAI0720913.1 iron-sulfur cluster biosynthesis transcriptional regulator SufR [Serratia entomophila]CAI0748194.1 iron-sulfur cluster biosynthesis transcriptional regulator SufR [Serratia entomophila]CAI0756682.1 iron-sulfur cluster biosynthesis transcriptional regulator SufR [Serratia entomophila]